MQIALVVVLTFAGIAPASTGAPLVAGLVGEETTSTPTQSTRRAAAQPETSGSVLGEEGIGAINRRLDVIIELLEARAVTDQSSLLLQRMTVERESLERLREAVSGARQRHQQAESSLREIALKVEQQEQEFLDQDRDGLPTEEELDARQQRREEAQSVLTSFQEEVDRRLLDYQEVENRARDQESRYESLREIVDERLGLVPQ